MEPSYKREDYGSLLSQSPEPYRVVEHTEIAEVTAVWRHTL